MDSTSLARTLDPGRGQFCAVNKRGVIQAAPPTKREPLVERAKNPRGVRHINKTAEDRQPVAERRRYKDWLARQ